VTVDSAHHDDGDKCHRLLAATRLVDDIVVHGGRIMYTYHTVHLGVTCAEKS